MHEEEKQRERRQRKKQASEFTHAFNHASMIPLPLLSAQVKIMYKHFTHKR